MKSYTILIDSTHYNCLPNVIDCARFYRYLLKNDHKIVKNPKIADFIIINSCAFTENQQNKTVEIYNNYHKIKKRDAKIIIYGCLENINPELTKNLDCIKIKLKDGKKIDSIFLKTIKFEDIEPYCTKKIQETLFGDKKEFSTWFKTPFYLTKLFLPFSKKMKNNYHNLIKSVTYDKSNFVEISTGCTNNCSYCQIKKAKGNISSRKTKDIISNIKEIYDPSKTLFLAADDCASYGFDKNQDFIDLFNEINKKFPDLKLDLNYLNPSCMEKNYDGYIKLFSSKKINLAIIPIQSGSQKIINKMNRKYNVEKLLKKMHKIKEASPKTILYAHFIVGFPGETFVDFIKTLIAAKYFDFPSAFFYSNEKGTKSYSFPNQKSKYVILSRMLIFIFFVNFVILYRLKHYSKEVGENNNDK